MERSTSTIRVGACQMGVTGDPDENLARVTEAVKRAARADARLLALPECSLSGYPPIHYDSPADIDAARIAELNACVCSAARDAGIAVVLGTVTMSSEGLLNSALVISAEGEILGRYDKLHLMPEDRKFFRPGWAVPVFDVAGASVGVQICYDARFPEAFRLLREQGAQVIVNISNACGSDTWKAPVLEGTYRARAAENSCYLVAVNAAGPLQMATSRIVSPIGLDLAVANQDREEDLFADLDLYECERGYFFDRRTDLFRVECASCP